MKKNSSSFSFKPNPDVDLACKGRAHKNETVIAGSARFGKENSVGRRDQNPNGFKSIRPFSNLHLPVVGFVGSNLSDPTKRLFCENKPILSVFQRRASPAHMMRQSEL
jgi:hypothetical protein